MDPSINPLGEEKLFPLIPTLVNLERLRISLPSNDVYARHSLGSFVTEDVMKKLTTLQLKLTSYHITRLPLDRAWFPSLSHLSFTVFRQSWEAQYAISGPIEEVLSPFIAKHHRTLQSLELEVGLNSRLDIYTILESFQHLERLQTFILAGHECVEETGPVGIQRFMLRHKETLTHFQISPVHDYNSTGSDFGPISITLDGASGFHQLVTLILEVPVDISEDLFNVIKNCLKQLEVLRITESSFDQVALSRFLTMLESHRGKPRLQDVLLNISSTGVDLLSRILQLIPCLELCHLKIGTSEEPCDGLLSVSNSAHSVMFLS